MEKANYPIRVVEKRVPGIYPQSGCCILLLTPFLQEGESEEGEEQEGEGGVNRIRYSMASRQRG